MKITRLLLGAAMALSLSSAAFAANKGPSLKDRQQAACYGDVQKFCGNFVPDVQKVTDCMKDKKPLVSAPCAAMWDVKS